MKEFMSHFVHFVTNHWILCSLFVVVLIALLVNEWIHRSFGALGVAPESAVLMMNHQHAIVLDIRGETSFLEGHVLGAHHLPSHSVEKKIGTLQKYKDKPIILVCTQGQESSKVHRQLKEKGFQVVVLEGGIQAWKAAGLPLVKP
jgi:rhodanese-related sulfurtransferase